MSSASYFPPLASFCSRNFLPLFSTVFSSSAHCSASVASLRFFSFSWYILTRTHRTNALFAPRRQQSSSLTSQLSDSTGILCPSLDLEHTSAISAWKIATTRQDSYLATRTQTRARPELHLQLRPTTQLIHSPLFSDSSRDSRIW